MQAGQHIFDNSHSSENTAILESSPNALACNRRWSLAANASSTKFDRTGRRLGIPANDVEERSLARTIRTDKGNDLARLNMETDRKSKSLNPSNYSAPRMQSSA